MLFRSMALGAIGFGVFMSFTGSIAIFIFTLFPLTHPLIDTKLIALDAGLGYVWADFVDGIAQYPVFGMALRYVYLSILPQMVGVIILLAHLNRTASLHRFLTVGIVCMILTVAFWWVYPSIGPGAYAIIPTDVQDKIGLFLDATYRAELLRLASEGMPIITLERIVGVIAFPSFHMIMACMVVRFTWRTWAFFPALIVNAAMVPATLSHGGHHLVDLFAAVVTFSLCLWAITRLIPAIDTSAGGSVQAAAA